MRNRSGVSGRETLGSNVENPIKREIGGIIQYDSKDSQQ